MLANLPIEIFKQILDLLSRNEIYHLLTTCKTIYQKSLPHLYYHLHIKDYAITRQLQYGINSNPFMSNVIRTHTKHLTLSSKQYGNTWRTSDLLHIFGRQSHITTLTFSNYDELATKTIHEVIAILPHVDHVEFKYCHIVYSPLAAQNNTKRLRFFLDPKQTDAANHVPLAENPQCFKSLSFTWTDFTQKSIIPALYSQITHLELGSNRNKYLMVNELMAKSVTRQCPSVTHLSIALPQVSESTLCDIVTHYGSQLQQLSVRCDSYNLLHAIALHSSSLTRLTIRISPSADNEKISTYMLKMIQGCEKLTELEVWSCYLENDIPLTVWESIIKLPSRLYTSDTMKLAQRVVNKNIENSFSTKITNTQPENTQQTGNAFALSSRVWFEADIFEDVLQQRYLYNLLNGNKQCSNIHEKLVIGHSVLQKCTMRMQELLA